MENSSVLAKEENNQVNEDNQVNEEKPPPRVCPRCDSDNTKFCYYNNYSVTQPRYFCKNCRRYWTHGGALRNIPIGGSCRKAKRAKVDHNSVSHVSQVVSVDIQQVQENNPFLGYFGGSSSSAAAAMNRFGSLPDYHGGVMPNPTPIRTFPPMDRFDYADGAFQSLFDAGSNDFIGNPLLSNNGFRMNHEENSNIMNMNHNGVSTSVARGPSGSEMNKNNTKIINNCVFSSSYHLEKNGP